MSTARHSLLGLLLVFGLPLMASAAPLPSEVSGIMAERAGNDVVVSWDSAGSGVAYYRVYWSSTSILENAGDYDDLQETEGPETTLTLKDAPKGDVYVAVIAVDEDGQESPTFAEEAMAMSAASSRPMGKAPELIVVKTMADGEDAFRITFDHAIALSLDALLEAVTVEDEKGRALAVTGMELISEDELLVMTETQKAGKYRVTLAQDAFYGLPKTMGNGAQLAMLPKVTTAAFVSEIEVATSSSSGRASSSASAAASSTQTSSVAAPVAPSRSTGSSSTSSTQSSSSSTPVVSAPSRTSSASSQPELADGPVRSLSLQPFSRPDGYVDVEVQWVIAANADVVGVAIAQSIDGGKTFSEWQPIDASLRTVRIARIPAGNFGVSLITADSTGQISEPAVRTLLIAAETNTPSTGRPVMGSVTGGNGDSPLTSSGPASILLTIVVAGAWAGSHLSRKVLPRK